MSGEEAALMRSIPSSVSTLRCIALHCSLALTRSRHRFASRATKALKKWRDWMLSLQTDPSLEGALRAFKPPPLVAFEGRGSPGDQDVAKAAPDTSGYPTPGPSPMHPPDRAAAKLRVSRPTQGPGR